MKVFLDDIRSIPVGYVGARGYEECIRLLMENKGNVEVISFDHDLGELKTGYDVCLWIVENEYYDGLKTVILHSANPVGIKNMIQLFDRYLPKEVEILYLNLSKEYERVYRK